jgi:hypothetical protein
MQLWYMLPFFVMDFHEFLAEWSAFSFKSSHLSWFCAENSGGSVLSSAVDIFNTTAGRWSTAVLSVARGYLAATSLPDFGIAIFAGGGNGNSSTSLYMYLVCVMMQF